MKKLAILLAIIIILLGCEQSSSSDDDGDVDFDPSNISLTNNREDSDIPQSTSVFTRLSTGEGIIGTWNRYTEATRTYEGEILTYRSTDKTDYFYTDGTYKIIVIKQVPVTNGYDGSETATKGTYTLSTDEDGSYRLTTIDKSGKSVFSFLVSQSYLLITE